MALRRCPRCNEYYEPKFFPDPVSLCIICYRHIPANKGLTVIQLYAKAQRSQMPRRRFRQLMRQEEVGAISPLIYNDIKDKAGDFLRTWSGRAKEREQGQQLTDDEKILCDLCNQLYLPTELSIFVTAYGEVAGCATCKAKHGPV